MKLIRFMSGTAAVAGVTLMLSGSALASDGGASIDLTGPESFQKIEVEHKNNVNITENNTVDIKNKNVQTAKSGEVKVERNASVGPVRSGDAINENSTINNVAIGERRVVETCCVQNSSCCTSGGPVAVGSGPVGGGVGAGPGNVLGASTPTTTSPASTSPTSTSPASSNVSPESMPEVGASSPIDVSALRAAWNSRNQTPVAAVATSTKGLAAMLLTVAAVLSMLGVAGSAVYVWRKEGRA